MVNEITNLRWKFTPSTNAKASELNENLNQLVSKINEVVQELTTISNSLSDVVHTSTSKANVLEVANAINNLDAVNLQTMKDFMKPFMGVILGYLITLNAELNTISITNGLCYDTTGKYQIYSFTGFSAVTTNRQANTTLQMYVLKDTTTTDNPTLQITPNLYPTLVNDNIVYRLIGTAKTDASGTIISVEDAIGKTVIR